MKMSSSRIENINHLAEPCAQCGSSQCVPSYRVSSSPAVISVSAPDLMLEPESHKASIAPDSCTFIVPVFGGDNLPSGGSSTEGFHRDLLVCVPPEEMSHFEVSTVLFKIWSVASLHIIQFQLATRFYCSSLSSCQCFKNFWRSTFKRL